MTENVLPVELLYPPIPFRQNGSQHLAFEIAVHNTSERTFALTGVQIASAQGILEEWSREATAANTRFLSEAYRPVESKQLEPGSLALLFCWVTLADDARVPTTLAATLTLEDTTTTLESLSLEVPVQQRKPLTIQPPLKGKGWLAGEAASNITGHRRTPLAFNGVAYIPQRYAVDWIKFDENGMLFHDTPEKNESWFGYGADVYAVADGAVLATLDGTPENVPLNEVPVIEITLENAAGNYVMQDLGGGQYALYAHLVPGSLTVKPGDRLKAGQVLGKLGNSGNSTGPHLHFHIGDRPAPLETQGLPYHFPAFVRAGHIGSMDELEALLVKEGQGWHSNEAPQACREEYMGSNDVIDF